MKLRHATNIEEFLGILKDKQKRGLEKIPGTSGKLNRKCLRFQKVREIWSLYTNNTQLDQTLYGKQRNRPSQGFRRHPDK